MKNSSAISIFFPTYNEEANIKYAVEAAIDAVREITSVYEVIIVNDGSKDETATIADELAKNNEHIKVIHHLKNQGYGAAVWSGIQAAKYEYVFFTDADLQFDMRELRKLVAYIYRYPMVLGYRAKRQDPFMRLVNAWGWNWLNRILFGLRVRDIDCAFKLFEKRLVAGLPIQSRGAMLSAEMLIRIQRMGVKWREVPVTHLPRMKGSATGAKPAVIIRAFKEMIAVYRGDLGGSRFIEFVKFAVVGVVNTAIDLGMYIFLTRFGLGTHFVLAKGISYLFGTVFSFVANRFWTFNVISSVKILEIVRFYSAVLLAVAVNVGSTYVFVSLLKFHDIFAVVLATGVTLVWNYALLRSWVYTKEKVLTSAPQA